MGKLLVNTTRRMEPVVSIPEGASLRAPQVAPTNIRSFLMSVSIKQSSGLDSRTALLNWDGVGGGIYTQASSGDGTYGLRVKLDNTEGRTFSEEEKAVASGQKYQALLSWWTDDTTMSLIAYMVVNNDWTEIINETVSTPTGAFLSLGTNAWEIFSERGESNHFFSGETNRLAVWLSTGSTAIADITQASVRNLFSSRNISASRRASVATLGNPVIDLAGDADDYENGVNLGTWANLVKSGPSIGVPEVVEPEDPPVIQDEPTIEGNLAIGATLTAEGSAVTGTPTITTEFDWYVDGALESEDSETFVPSTSVNDQDVYVIQRSSSEFGSSQAQSETVVIPGTGTVFVDSTPPNIARLAGEYDDADNELLLTHTTVERDSLPVTFWVVSSAALPTRAQIEAGEDSTGTAATIAATWQHTTSGSVTRTVTDPASGTYTLYMLAKDNADNYSAIRPQEVTI